MPSQVWMTVTVTANDGAEQGRRGFQSRAQRRVSRWDEPFASGSVHFTHPVGHRGRVGTLRYVSVVFATLRQGAGTD
jgi:hypothetical protein